MAIVKTTTYADPKLASLELPVTVEGMKIVVGSGGFRFNGESLSLDDDVEFTVKPDATHGMAVIGYLVKVKADDSVDVVVDEILGDGVDIPYNFKGSPYEMLTRIYFCEVAAGETSLDTVNIYAASVVSKVVVDDTRGSPRDVPFVAPDPSHRRPFGAEE